LKIKEKEKDYHHHHRRRCHHKSEVPIGFDLLVHFSSLIQFLQMKSISQFHLEVG